MAGKAIASKKHQVVDSDAVTAIQKFRNKDAAFVPGAAGDENVV
jgi:hypothetical protein